MRDVGTPDACALRELPDALPVERIAESGEVIEHPQPPLFTLLTERGELLLQRGVGAVHEVAEQMHVRVVPSWGARR